MEDIQKETLNEKPDSVSLKRNSKGYTWDIKLYYDCQKEGYEPILATLSEINSKLKQDYGQDN